MPNKHRKDKAMKKALLECFGIIASVILLIIVSVSDEIYPRLAIYGSLLMAIINPIATAKKIMNAISEMQHWIDRQV